MEAPGSWSKPVDVQYQGTSLWVKPLQPLRPSHRYQLDLSNDGDWSPIRQVQGPRAGMSLMTLSPGFSFATADTSRLVIEAPGGALVVRDGTARLAAAASRVVPGTRYRWSQLSGPALVFDSPEAEETVVRLADRGGQADAARVRPTISNDRGDSELIDRGVRTVGDGAGPWMLHFSSPSGEYVGAGITEYLGQAFASFTFVPYPAGTIAIAYRSHAFPRLPSAFANLDLSNGTQDATLAVGRYTVVPGTDGPTLSLSVDSRACGFGDANSEFGIFELDRDPSGTPTRMAARIRLSPSGRAIQKMRSRHIVVSVQPSHLERHPGRS